MERLFFVLLIGILPLVSFSQSNQKLDEKVRLSLEVFQKDVVYVSNGLDLWRANHSTPSRRDSLKFHSIIDCSFDFEYYNQPMSSLPDELPAFGRIFTKKEAGDYYTTYASEELDSEIHYLSFAYSGNQLVAVEINSLNVRSNKIHPKYLYRFRRRR